MQYISVVMVISSTILYQKIKAKKYTKISKLVVTHRLTWEGRGMLNSLIYRNH